MDSARALVSHRACVERAIIFPHLRILSSQSIYSRMRTISNQVIHACHSEQSTTSRMRLNEQLISLRMRRSNQSIFHACE